MIDYGIPQGQPGTPGSGSGDVVAAGNNVFTGTNHFEGLTVLGETHAETPTNNNDVTNKLYVDTLAGTTKTSAVTEADEHTDNKISALRTLPAGGTSGQVPTIASDGESVEWKTPSGGGGGGGIEWVEVTPSQPDSSNLNTDYLKLWYDKNDHQHLKFEGYIWATSEYSSVLSLIMPDVFSPVVTDMWTPLLSLSGTNTSYLTSITLYVKYTSSHRLKIFPSGHGASWLTGRLYAVGSEIYLNPSQQVQSNSDEVNDDINIHSGDGGGGGIEWVEVTPSQPDSSNLNTDYLKLWYDKNDHQHLKFEGYIWATSEYSSVLSLIMPDVFSPVVTDMWTPLLSLSGTNTSYLTSITLYVKYTSSHRLKIFPSGHGASWLTGRLYAVGSEIYLNPSQQVQSNSDEVNDDINIHSGDGAETQHGE